MATTTLKVTGMTCNHCAHTVKTALENLDGVQSADVDLSGGRAVVKYDESETSPREMAGAVMQQGYRAEELPAVSR